jgi:F like protein
VNSGQLITALEAKNVGDVEAAMSPGISAFERSFLAPYRTAMTNILAESGLNTAKQLKQGSLKVSAKKDTTKVGIDFVFDKTNPEVVDWINQHTLEGVDGISQATRDKVRDILAGAFDEQVDPKDLADDLVNAIGDAARADVIARTESMIAANEGQAAAWEQATDAGLLSGTEKKTWIITDDDRLCPICEGLADQTVPLDDNFQSPDTGEEFDVPPAHPNCRCTTGLVG